MRPILGDLHLHRSAVAQLPAASPATTNGAAADEAERHGHPPLGFRELVLPSSLIGVDNGPEGYQRPLAESKLKKIYPYDIALGGTLAVNERPDGSLWCFDGQHRLQSARRSGLRHVPCRVFRVSRQREARYFIEMNWSTLVVNARDKFRALIVAGDPQSCAIKAVIEEARFRLDFESKSYAADAVSAVDTARALTRSRRRGVPFDTAPLRAALELIRATWPGQPANGTAVMLRASDAVLRRGGSLFDQPRFVERLFVYTPAMLARAGALYGRTHNVTAWAGAAERMIEEYNTGLPRHSKRALPSLLDR
jgi:hypothetical protein